MGTGEAGGDRLRIGTAEREDAIRVLGDHFGAGRLQMGEYEERVDAVTRSVTRGDLRVLFADLPPPHPPFLVPPTWPAPPLPVYPAPVHPAPPPEVYSPKSKLVAGLLQIFIPLGIGRFYTGHHGIAVAQLLTCGGFGIWSVVDGILLLVTDSTDAEGRRLRD